MGVKVNETLLITFRLRKVFKGDPLSPILFNIVADMLVVLIGRAKEKG